MNCGNRTSTWPTSKRCFKLCWIDLTELKVEEGHLVGARANDCGCRLPGGADPCVPIGPPVAARLRTHHHARPLRLYPARCGRSRRAAPAARPGLGQRRARQPRRGGVFPAPLAHLSTGEKPREIFPVEAEPARRNVGGRLAHQPTEATRREVRGAAAFIPHEAITALVGISNKTLLKHYREELDLGDAQGCLRGAKALSQLIEDGSERRSSTWPRSS